MQREIKFRGQRIDNNEWVYGYYYKDIQRNSFVPEKPILWEKHFIRLLEADGIFLAYEVKPETIGQFTGLYDRREKEIYKKDIVKTGTDKLMVITWSERFASFCIERKGWAFKHWFGEAFEAKECEIVGNIIDNPELLNE
jgi:uncharacterized phage protein (TIGR01671 family)